MRVYGPYDPPPSEGLACKEKSLARQSEAAACDINTIMKRYEQTGEFPVAVSEGFFADVSVVGDYQQLQERLLVGKRAFEVLPVDVRSEFGNDAAAFMDFAADPKNAPRLEELGLLPKAVVPPKGADEPTDKPPVAAPASAGGEAPVAS